MRLTEEVMQQRRDLIIKKAYTLFAKQGIDRVKIEKVAKNSKVSANTIYRYFGNKENLVLEVFVQAWNRVMSDLSRHAKGTPEYESKTGYEQIQVWMDEMAQLYREKREFILFSNEAKLHLVRHHVKLDAVHQDIMMGAVRSSCISSIEKGKRDGSIPSEEDSGDLFYAIWGTLRGYVLKIVVYNDLYGESSPFGSRYPVVEKGILCALKYGWEL